jgi:hypothetical protein
MTRVADSTNPLIGGWVLTNIVPANGSPTNSAYFVFGLDGNRTMVQTAVTQGSTTSWPGLEWGTYSWNATTGALTLPCPAVDTNGDAGSSGLYASYTSGLISAGGNPVGTAGGGLPVGTCSNANSAWKATVSGNVVTLNTPNGSTATFNRIIY